MSVLGYGRKLIAYLFYYMAARLDACLFPTSINLTLRDNRFRKIFNACWRESAKPLSFYCGTMPASLLVDQRQMIVFFIIIRLYAALTVFCESFADCICMRPRDCFQSIMFFRGIPAT